MATTGISPGTPSTPALALSDPSSPPATSKSAKARRRHRLARKNALKGKDAVVTNTTESASPLAKTGTTVASDDDASSVLTKTKVLVITEADIAESKPMTSRGRSAKKTIHPTPKTKHDLSVQPNRTSGFYSTTNLVENVNTELSSKSLAAPQSFTEPDASMCRGTKTGSCAKVTLSKAETDIPPTPTPCLPKDALTPSSEDGSTSCTVQTCKSGFDGGSIVTPTSSLIARAVNPAATTKDVSPQPNSSKATTHPVSPSPTVEQDLDNLLEMIRQQRESLLSGPRINVYIGDAVVKGIFKRAAMASSSVLHDHFINNAESLEYHFPTPVDPNAVRLLLITWMHDTCHKFEAHAVPRQATFAQDMAVLRAARFLGMERYTKHTLSKYVGYLRNELPSYDEVVAVEVNATSHKDPCWTAMVNHLCFDRFNGNIPDPKVFESFLEDHPRLKKAMDEADAYFAGVSRQKQDAIDAERRQRWEKNQAEKQERIAREKMVAESLKQKLDRKNSGLMMVTAEEAMMLRNR